jgi:acyl dehydratase
MSDRTTPPTAADVEVGDSLPELTVEDVGLEEFVRYAGSSGDFTPLHYDEEVAQGAGYDGPIAQGMLLAGYAATAVTEWAGRRAIRSFSTRFSNTVPAGVTVTVDGEVTDQRKADGESEFEVEFDVRTETGTEALTGTATVALPDERDGPE